jgi:hypothetical protein
MAITAKLGTVDSQLNNIELGKGANPLPYKIFSGIYTVVDGKADDTLFLSITYPSYITVDIEIPNPFIESGLIGEEPTTLGQQM